MTSDLFNIKDELDSISAKDFMTFAGFIENATGEKLNLKYPENMRTFVKWLMSQEFSEDGSFELSGCDTKSGNPVVIDFF